MTDRHTEQHFQTWVRGLVLTFVCAAMLFTVWPGLDLWVAGLFWNPERGFYLAHVLLVQASRRVILWLMYLVPLVAVAALALAALGVRLWGVPGRLWAFLLALNVAGPGLVANVVLKGAWGRARPADVEVFGGALHFTPALRWTSECATNCSFVSGEGAGATALAIAMVLLAPYAMRGWSVTRRRRYLFTALILPGLGLVLRVAMGRHFLSDTVFAVLLVLAVATLLYGPIVGFSTRRMDSGR